MNTSLPTLESARSEAASIARGEPQYLTESAILYAQEQVCADLDLYADWLAGDRGERAASIYFGPISVRELCAMQMNPRATAAQHQAANLELRTRYLAEKNGYVLKLAREASA